MEVETEKTLSWKPSLVSLDDSEDSSTDKIYRHECAGEAHSARDEAQDSLNDPDCTKESSLGESAIANVHASTNQGESSDGCSQSSEEQADFIKERKGTVVMEGADFWVEIDPDYESGDASDEEFDSEDDAEGRESQGCADTALDATASSPGRQELSLCPASARSPHSEEAALDVSVVCESSGGGGDPEVEKMCRDDLAGWKTCHPSVSKAQGTASGSSTTPDADSLPDGSADPHCVGNECSSEKNCKEMTASGHATTSQKKMVVSVATTHSRGKMSCEKAQANGKPDSPDKCQQIFSCIECDKTFGHKSSLKRHISAVHSKMMGQNDAGNGDVDSDEVSDKICSACGKTFSHKDVLKRHIAIVHSAEKKFTCSECGKKYSYAHTLKVHIETVHRGNKKFTCPECGLKFALKTNLKIHYDVVHEGIKNFSCSECGKRFGTKSTMKIHVDNVHRRVRRFACSECGMRFGQTCNLMDHIRVVHRNERNFICFECGSVFGHKSALNMHVNTVHKGIRKYACPECGKRFGQGCGLKTHMSVVHRQEKNYTCSECGKKFGQKGYLKTHVATVHRGEKKHACAVCGKTFGQSGSLSAHYKIHKEK